MRTFIVILIFGLLTAFQVERDEDLGEFITTQLDDFEIIQTYKTEYFVNSIENYGFHNKKSEIAIKAKESHSNKNSYNKTVYTRIQMWQFDFETKEKCKQAIDSLFNCFPNDCAKIKRQVDQGIKITPSIWIFTDKKIVIANTACEQVDQKWTEFKKEFVEYFANNETEIIVTECGKLTWTTKEKIITTP